MTLVRASDVCIPDRSVEARCRLGRVQVAVESSRGPSAPQGLQRYMLDFMGVVGKVFQRRRELTRGNSACLRHRDPKSDNQCCAGRELELANICNRSNVSEEL